jgi:ferric-dicitrate binding protein FerR (iron transport regulator)
VKVRMNIALVLSLLLVTLPVLPAEPPAAVGKLTTRGAAEVNGTALPNEATVFSGDRLATQKDSAMALSLGAGNQVFFPELTRARLERNGNETKVSLERGALAVVSRSGNVPVVETSGVRIQTAGLSPAIFEVAVSGTSLKVLVRAGTMRVIAADRTVEVPEGKMLEATMTPAQPAPQAAPAGTGMTSGLSTIQVIAIAGSLAVGLTGLALGAVALTRPNPQDCKIVGSSPATIKCP